MVTYVFYVGFSTFVLMGTEKLKRTVRSEFAEVSIREEGIIQSRIFPGSKIDLKDAEEYLAMVQYLTKGTEHATVIDMTGVRSITPAARAFLQVEPVKSGKTMAVAMIANSFISRIMSTFFLQLYKPSCPVKLFQDSTDAYGWVKNEYHQSLMRKAS